MLHNLLFFSSLPVTVVDGLGDCSDWSDCSKDFMFQGVVVLLVRVSLLGGRVT